MPVKKAKNTNSAKKATAPAKKLAGQPAAELTWPAGATRTPTRQMWFARLSALPPGLTIRDAADRLRRSAALVGFWMKAFGYRPADGMAVRLATAAARWADVDWTQTDAAISARVGVSQQA